MEAGASTAEERRYLADLRARRDRAWPPGMPRTLTYPFGELPITDYLRERARSTPERTAFIFYGSEISFGRLNELSDHFGAFLMEQGVLVGDRVAVMLPNCPQFVIAFYGILKAGAVHVPVNSMFKEAELAYELVDSGAGTLLVQDSLCHLVEPVRPRTRLRRVLTTSVAEYLPAEPAFPVHPSVTAHPVEEVAGTVPWRDVLAAPLPGAWPPGDLDRLAALNYTGGTTGLPKGCRHTQRHMIYTAACAASMRTTPRTGDEVGLVFIPVFWIAGENALIGTVFSGTTCVLMTRWDPAGVLAAIQRFRVSGMGATVDGYTELMEDPRLREYDLSTLHAPGAMSFVRKLTVDIRRRWQELVGEHSILREGAYGMTETHTIDTFTAGFQTDDHDLKSQPVFCGMPMPGTEIKIIDFDSKALVPIDAEGEIWIRTPSLLDGYWEKPEVNAGAFEHGWFRTGDIGAFDGDGCLHFLGRRKEMLKVNGMSVFPSELEVLLSHHPDVEGSGVVGRPDAERGEVPVAYVKLRSGANTDAASLAAWCRRNMASYKVPEIELIPDLPLTATGKVRKELLKPRDGVASVAGSSGESAHRESKRIGGRR